MGRFRFSTRWLMLAVAMAAVESAALRASIRSSTSLISTLMISLPMLNLLTIGLILMRKCPARARAFLVGFEAIGWLAVVCFCIDGLRGFPFLHLYGVAFCGPTITFVAGKLGFSVQDVLRDQDSARFWLLFVPLEWLCFLPLQLLPALIGGWLSSHYRVRSSIDRRRLSEPVAGLDREPASPVMPDEGLVPGMARE